MADIEITYQMRPGPGEWVSYSELLKQVAKWAMIPSAGPPAVTISKRVTETVDRASVYRALADMAEETGCPCAIGVASAQCSPRGCAPVHRRAELAAHISRSAARDAASAMTRWLLAEQRAEQAEARLGRIAHAHSKETAAEGMTSGDCNECGHAWPCPTYTWATSERDPLATWDPADDDATEVPDAAPVYPEPDREYPVD